MLVTFFVLCLSVVRSRGVDETKRFEVSVSKRAVLNVVSGFTEPARDEVSGRWAAGAWRGQRCVLGVLVCQC